MNLESHIKKIFPEGLSYDETAQLCLLLYSNEIDNFSESIKRECNKDTLATIFANLAKEGFITTEPIEAPIYGANYHELNEKGHWIEIIASIFKKGNTVNDALFSKLKTRLISYT